MNRHAGPPLKRFGYRGRALSLVGIVWILIGVATYADPDRDPAQILLVEYLPLWLRIVLWVGAGVVALVTSWWPPGADRFGFMALIAPAMIRAGSYGWSWLTYWLTGGELGDKQAWIDGLAWFAIVAFVLLLAAWPEPGETKRRGK